MVRNSPAIKDTIFLFCTYIAFHNFYMEKSPSYDEFNHFLGHLVLDLLSNLGFCSILASLPVKPTTEAIERVLHSLSGSNLVVYVNHGDTSQLPFLPPAGNSL